MLVRSRSRPFQPRSASEHVLWVFLLFGLVGCGESTERGMGERSPSAIQVHATFSSPRSSPHESRWLIVLFRDGRAYFGSHSGKWLTVWHLSGVWSESDGGFDVSLDWVRIKRRVGGVGSGPLRPERRVSVRRVGDEYVAQFGEIDRAVQRVEREYLSSALLRRGKPTPITASELLNIR